ncbi:MAG: FecR domain-containing protein [Armatimonadota bacterium]
MSSNKLPPNDPVELLNEHYEDIKMRESYRRELQKRTRDIVAARRRSPIIRWTFSLGACAALIATILVAGRLMYSGPKDIPTAPVHKQIALSTNNTKRPAAHIRKNAVASAGHPNTGNCMHHTAGTTDNINLPGKKPYAEDTVKTAHKPVCYGPPVVALTNVIGNVTNGQGIFIAKGERIAVGTAIRTGKGGRATLVTLKGSEINLDSNTELLFTSAKVAKIVRGRLYCANHDKEIARIDTPAGRVVLLGTVVDTNVVRDDAVAVTVVEGKVRLSNRHGDALVNAGSQSLLMAYLAPKPGKAVNTYKETSWYHGRGDYQSDFGDIAYTVNREKGLITEIWTVKSDGTNRHRIASFIGWATEIGPWLPGERWLSISLISALWTTPDIKNRSANTGNGHPIIKDRVLLLDAATGKSIQFDLPESYRPFYSAFAPDPTLVAFSGTYYPNADSYKDAGSGLWLYDRKTLEVTKLLSGNIKTAPAWAPDSRHIAISSGQGYTNEHNLVIIDTQTGQTQDIGINGAGACFSPNGKKIAFSSDFQKGGSWYAGVPMSGGIFALDLTRRADAVRLSPENVWATRPRWSPDGSRILYITGDNKVCVVNSDGTGAREVYCSQQDNISKASWDSTGNLIFVTDQNYRTGTANTVLVGSDGSGVKKTFSQACTANQLTNKDNAQSDAACSAINEAIFQYAMGNIYAFEGNLDAEDRSYGRAANIFSKLVWDYPLSGLCTDDVLKYSEAADKKTWRPDSEALFDCCTKRICYLGDALVNAAAKYHQFPPNLSTGLEWASNLCWQSDWLSSSDKKHVMMLGTCPGTVDQAAEAYVYNIPADGKEPEVGQVIVSCPLHTDNTITWSEYDHQIVNPHLITDAKPGAVCKVANGLPYWLENVGTGGLTIIHHMIGNTYEVQGEAKLLPTGRIYTNESLKIADNEGDIAQDIDSAGRLDWGNLSSDDTEQSFADLDFCRAVAKFEAGLPVTELDGKGNIFKTMDGEPARLLYCGSPRGSCGAIGSDLRFELIGSEKIYLYQLKPSGRFNVTGTVKVQQTGQVCTDGWIDKDGNVISTQKN